MEKAFWWPEKKKNWQSRVSRSVMFTNSWRWSENFDISHFGQYLWSVLHQQHHNFKAATLNFTILLWKFPNCAHFLRDKITPNWKGLETRKNPQLYLMLANLKEESKCIAAPSPFRGHKSFSNSLGSSIIQRFMMYEQYHKYKYH